MAAAVPQVSLSEIRQRLRAFDFRGLFNDLGWEHHRTTHTVEVDGIDYTLEGIAHKRGFQVFRCSPGPDGAIPERAVRRRIDRQTNAYAQEHLLIFADEAETAQLWQWVRREPGKPLQHHEHEVRAGQTGEALAQRVRRLSFAIEDEDALTIPDVVRRVRGGLAAEKVTKKFYDDFKKKHDEFQALICGISEVADRDWYASLMLNRLMFIYFIQKKGFLDNDPDYLRHKLVEVRENRGDDQFLTFYRVFLRKLFHEGLSHQAGERSRELEALLGEVPYLNGGLFDVHQLEQTYAEIDVPDEAFENVFDFFDGYRWHLDERPLRADDEINPDVLGYIFEKYVNQKQMGAYYTKEDITGYIARNTIVPALFDMTRPEARIAFEPGSALWRLLQENPDRYIYPAMQKGTDLSLPAEIAAGVDDVAQRGGWNRQADDAFKLPTETWREHVARRRRYEEVWGKLVDGEVSSIDDLITLNLDIHQFAVDAIAECEGPETLRAFWRAIETISVLDPTCGSGAFLFAALNILQPLAEACLERMQAFVDEADRAEEVPHPERYRDFRKVLDHLARHPNREYFVLKQIVLNNLYGVDIMEEAVEICKLRLFLKLVAQLETYEQIEPLPDIDFNIRAGNTLVGFASFADVDTALRISGPGQMQMMEIIESTAPDALRRIDEEAEKTAKAFQRFRAAQQDEDNATELRRAKADVRVRLADLREQLDELQARVYAVDPDGPDYEDWRKRHEPFHWVTEFYGIVHGRGGFDVIIGNPPWAEYSTVRRAYQIREYRTERSGNLYAFCSERSLQLLAPHGRFSFIVQLPIASSPRMQHVRELLDQRGLHVSTFDDRPGKLFDGLQHCRSAIFVSSPAGSRSKCGGLWTTSYQRWPTSRRDSLFSLLEYVKREGEPAAGSVWRKYGTFVHERALERAHAASRQVLASAALDRRSEHFVFYQESAQYWIKVASHIPYYARNGTVASPAHGRFVCFLQDDLAQVASALMNSSFFYSLFIAVGDCFHVNDSLVRSIPVTPELLEDFSLRSLNERLMVDLQANAGTTTISTRDGDQITYAEYFANQSKHIIDEIDRILAKHYGFTDEELDFIINFDIKYRMGLDGDPEAA